MLNKATRSQTKEHNTRLILQAIFEQPGLSRAEIARLTQLTRPTVSTIVDDLIHRNLVLETGVGTSYGGKKPILLEFAKDRQTVMGIHLSGKAFTGALANLRGEIFATQKFVLDDRDPQNTFETLLNLIRSLLQQVHQPILGIGIASPGLVDYESGIIRNSVNLNWVNLPLKKILQERFQIPVHLSNDSHLAALAEYQFGKQKASPNLIAINVFAGIGAGIILNGELFVGDFFSAGEIGHVVVDSQGAQCVCGNRGCLETIVNGRYLANLLHALKSNSDSAPTLLKIQGGYLGHAIAQIAGLLNIRQTVLVSEFAELGEPFLDAVRAGIQSTVLPQIAAQTEVRYSQLNNSSLLGAISLVLRSELRIS